jgi:hypothetical protein
VAGPSGATPKYAIPYPILTDTADPPRDFLAAATRVEALLAAAVTVPSSDLNTVVNDGSYYSTPTTSNRPFDQYAIVKHTSSPDLSLVSQVAHAVSGTANAAYRYKNAGVWTAWTLTGALPGISRASGQAIHPVSGTGSTTARNAWANLITARCRTTITLSAPADVFVKYGCWLTLNPTSNTAQDIRVFPMITKPDATKWGVSSMPATTNNVPGFSWGDVCALTQSDSGTSNVYSGQSSGNGFVFNFPAGTSTVELMDYRYFPSGAAGSCAVNYASLALIPLRYT